LDDEENIFVIEENNSVVEENISDDEENNSAVEENISGI
jgi:hypothetical protein